MKLTPLDIRHQEFTGAVPGFNRRAVREYLAELSDFVEELLREQMNLQSRVLELENRNEEYRRGEDELRRTLVSAERITAELKGNAQRESELMLREAEAERDRVLADLRATQADLERDVQARQSQLERALSERLGQLEMDFMTRQSELESTYRQRHAELEAQYQSRTTALEQEALMRGTQLENSLTRLRSERAQLLAQSRTLLSGYRALLAEHEQTFDVQDAVDWPPAWNLGEGLSMPQEVAAESAPDQPEAMESAEPTHG